LNSPLPWLSFIPLLPIPGTVSTGVIFCIYIHVHTFVHHIYPPTPIVKILK
jgi:hypothetical protein